MDGKHTERGFTLTELLVSTAIFTIMMSAIVTLFVASLHAVKSAYLAADAYENSRGAFNVVERDLSTVFTMRDYGDYYQFYGTPQGMMMVGLIRAADGTATLGRITYVIFPVVVKDNLNEFRVTGPFDLPQLNTRPVPMQELDDNGTPAILTDDTMVDIPIGTAALIRYVEPGVEDLDSYPFDWNTLATYTDPEFGTNIIKEELDQSIANDLGFPQDSSDPDIILRLDPIRQQFLAAKKRELWIRMLAGQEYWIPRLSGGAPQLPNVWGEFDPSGNVRTASFLDPAGLRAFNPRDYVVAENVGLLTPLAGPNLVPLAPLQGGDFFRYGRVLPTTQILDEPTWNSQLNFDNALPVGSPVAPRLPEVVTVRLPFAYERPYPTAPQFERSLAQVIDVPTAYTRATLTAAP